MTRMRLACCLLVSLVLAADRAWPQVAPARNEASRPIPAFQRAAGPRAFTFPADHGAHPSHRVEWWYVTGHLEADDGAAFGFQFTVFRVGLEGAPASRPSRLAARDLWFGHLALTDVSGNRLLFDERASRGMLGLARAAEDRLEVHLDDWTLREIPGGAWKLAASARGGAAFGIDLELRSEKPPALHGRSPGWSRKGPEPHQSSYYASLTRLATTGSISMDGRVRPVKGAAWFDHEFGSDQLAPDLTGWDWFAVQLDDGSELMIYVLRRADGSASPFSAATYVAKDGTTTFLDASAFKIDATRSWRSPRSKATYPARWTVAVPSLDLRLDLAPRVADQELTTGRSTRVTYFEGACVGSGTRAGRPVSALAYVELTGYAEPITRF